MSIWIFDVVFGLSIWIVILFETIKFVGKVENTNLSLFGNAELLRVV